ncbi:hypothetical protein BR1R3_34580 [Pseudomonas atacamensis]|nr:hypothetical protein BR1R3_34580 [Pseudomonas atacamensis]
MNGGWVRPWVLAVGVLFKVIRVSGVKALTLALSLRERGLTELFVEDSPTCDFGVERKS